MRKLMFAAALALAACTPAPAPQPGTPSGTVDPGKAPAPREVSDA